MSILTNKNINNFVNNRNVRNFVSRLCTPAALLPVVLLESTVIVGRTYQAKKRGGMIEARERFTEETISSIIWLWGIGLTNKAFDFLIDKVGKVKEKTGVKDFNFDTGNDYVRQPFEHVTEGLSKAKKNSIAALKLSKIVASAAISVGFMGFVLPKINQKITKKMLDKKEQQTGEHIQPIKIEHRKSKKTNLHEFLAISRNSVNNSNKKSSIPSPKKMDINEFLTMSRGSAGDPEFRGGTLLEIAAHQLENNNITQLLTIDGGLFTGRAVNARNKYEQREILFRDITSSFFYVAATPLIYKVLCKLDSLKGKNTAFSPDTAHDFHEMIQGAFGQRKEMPKTEFEEKLFGKKQVSDEIFNKAEGMFKNDMLSVKDMNKFMEEHIADAKRCFSLKDKALRLSKLQPAKIGEEILTKSQLTNLFRDGILNEPEFINKLIDDLTGAKAMNPIKFVSQKQVDKERKTIVDYAQSLLEQLNKEKSSTISVNFLQKMKNRNIITKFGYWGVGMVISAYFLSTAIPKIQYWMTKKTTGHDEFPGIQQYEKDFKSKNT